MMAGVASPAWASPRTAMPSTRLPSRASKSHLGLQYGCSVILLACDDRLACQLGILANRSPAGCMVIFTMNGGPDALFLFADRLKSIDGQKWSRTEALVT